MNKTKSLFTKLLIIILPLVLIAHAVVMSAAYWLTYRTNLDQAYGLLQSVAEEVALSFEIYDPDSLEEGEQAGYYLSSICRMVDLTYIYAIEPNEQENSVKYYSIGFGDLATEEARLTHYSGRIVYRDIFPPEKDAFHGKKSGNFREVHNKFGDMLICYVPVNNYYDNIKNKKIYNEIRSIVGVEMSITDLVKSFRARFIMIAIFMLISSVIIVTTIIIVVYKRVSVPAQEISKRMTRFVSDREKEQNIKKLDIKGNDEFSRMVSSFNTMTDEIDRYISDIDALTKEKHISEAELNIARNIQMGLLQPNLTETDRYTIRAYMLPAKDVGGDLYDYHIMDDGSVFIAIADVSGKGVSAALFMSRAITLLNQFAMAGFKPSQILERYNRILASSNPGGLFITTFIAFYHPDTGEMIYSNSGHNFPYILSDDLIPLEEAHGVAAGIFSSAVYKDATVTLKPGDTLFLFTDGVNEAKNVEDDFYTTERLEEKLRECRRRQDSDTLHAILDDLSRFTEGAEQNDDITMLTLCVKERENDSSLHLRSDAEEIS